MLLLSSIIYLILCYNTSNGQSAKKYFLIAGSYKTETEAQHAVDSLKTVGFPSEIVGTSNSGSIRVSFNSFDNYSDATKELNRIKNQITPNVWILEGKAETTNSQEPNSNNKSDSNKKKSYNWIWWTVGIIILLVVLGVIFDSRCPKCKKFFVKKNIGRKEISRKQFYKTENREEIIKEKGKEIGRVQKKVDVPYFKVEFMNYFECANCRHTWETTSTKECLNPLNSWTKLKK